MMVATSWMAAAVSGLVALGGIRGQVTQQQTPTTINVDSVVAELGLTGDAQTQATANLNELNQILVRRGQAGAECDQIRAEMADVFTNISSLLTPAQWRQLRGVFRSTGVMGRMGHSRGPGMRGMGSAQGCSGDMPAMGAGMHRGSGMRDGGPMHRAGPRQRMGRGAGS